MGERVSVVSTLVSVRIRVPPWTSSNLKLRASLAKPGRSKARNSARLPIFAATLPARRQG